MSGINEWPAGEVYTLLALWGQEDMNQARAYEHNEAFQRLLASRLYFHGYRRTFVEVSLQIQALVEKFQKDNKAKSEGKDVPYWEYDKHMNKLMEKFILDAEDSSSTEEECETCPEPVISLKDQELAKKEVNDSPSVSPSAEKYSMDVSGGKMKEMDPQQNPKTSTQINIKRPQTRAIFRYPTLGQMVSSDRATIPYLPKSKTSPIVNSSLPQQSIKSTTLSQQAGAASGCFKTPATLPIPRTTCKRARPKTPPMQEAQPKPPKLIPKLVPVQQAPQIQNATPDQNTGYLLKSIVNVESKRLQVERDHYRRLECVGNNVLRKLNEMLPDIKEGEQKDQK